MTRALITLALVFAAVAVGSAAEAWIYERNVTRQSLSARAFIPSGPSQQVVSSVPVSIAFAGEE